MLTPCLYNIDCETIALIKNLSISSLFTKKLSKYYVYSFVLFRNLLRNRTVHFKSGTGFYYSIALTCYAVLPTQHCKRKTSTLRSSYRHFKHIDTSSN